MAAPASKPIPVPTPTTQPYWDGTARDELWIQRCVTTGKTFTYPRRWSPFVVGGEVEWIKASGRGRLHSYVITHLAGPGYRDDLPYVIAVVELEEGPKVIANLVDVDATPEALPLDIALRVTFTERGDQKIPQFRVEAHA